MKKLTEKMLNKQFKKLRDAEPPKMDNRFFELLDKQSPPPPSLPDRSEKEREMHATLENPCYCFCHANGNEDECRYCKKVNKIVKKARHQYAEELRGEIEKEKINCPNELRTNPLTKHRWWWDNGYDEALDWVLSLLERKGEK